MADNEVNSRMTFKVPYYKPQRILTSLVTIPQGIFSIYNLINLQNLHLEHSTCKIWHIYISSSITPPALLDLQKYTKYCISVCSRTYQMFSISSYFSNPYSLYSAFHSIIGCKRFKNGSQFSTPLLHWSTWDFLHPCSRGS